MRTKMERRKGIKEKQENTDKTKANTAIKQK